MTAESLLSHRILFLSDPITSATANRLVADLLLLDADDHEAQIDLYINCAGGSVQDGLAVIDAMHCISAPVSTVCIGQACSMAAVVLAAGLPGRRLAAPNAEIMLHQVAGAFSGQAEDVRILSERMLRMQDSLTRMLADWTGQSPERIRQDMAHEFFMTAAQARDYGLLDEVLVPFGGACGATA